MDHFLNIRSCPIVARNIKQNKSTTCRCEQLPVAFSQIKILRAIFEKGHQRKTSVNLYQNMTSGFMEEEVLRFSSWWDRAISPSPPELYFLMEQNFTNTF